MSEEDKKPKDDDATFDMYHFFSRKDVILTALLILALLLLFVFLSITGSQSA